MCKMSAFDKIKTPYFWKKNENVDPILEFTSSTFCSFDLAVHTLTSTFVILIYAALNMKYKINIVHHYYIINEKKLLLFGMLIKNQLFFTGSWFLHKKHNYILFLHYFYAKFYVASMYKPMYTQKSDALYQIDISMSNCTSSHKKVHLIVCCLCFFVLSQGDILFVGWNK